MTQRPRRCLRFYPAYTDQGRSQKFKTTRFSYFSYNIVRGVALSATANRGRLSPVSPPGDALPVGIGKAFPMGQSHRMPPGADTLVVGAAFTTRRLGDKPQSIISNTPK